MDRQKLQSHFGQGSNGCGSHHRHRTEAKLCNIRSIHVARHIFPSVTKQLFYHPIDRSRAQLFFRFGFRFVQKQMGIWKTGYDDDRVVTHVANLNDKNLVWVEMRLRCFHSRLGFSNWLLTRLQEANNDHRTGGNESYTLVRSGCGECQFDGTCKWRRHRWANGDKIFPSRRGHFVSFLLSEDFRLRFSHSMLRFIDPQNTVHRSRRSSHDYWNWTIEFRPMCTHTFSYAISSISLCCCLASLRLG